MTYMRKLLLIAVFITLFPASAFAAVTVDASSPVRTNGAGTGTTPVTSASFTAPTDSFLIVCVTSDGSSADATTITATVSDSGGLTWTKQVERTWTETTNGGQSAIWTARTVSSVARTVAVARTATGGSALIRRTSFKVYVLTGVDVNGTPIDTISANNENGSLTNSISTTSITPGANGLLFFVDTDWAANGNFVAVAGQTQDTNNFATEISVLSGFKTAVSGVGVTATLDAAGTAAAQHKWCTMVVREAAAAGGSNNYGCGLLLCGVSR